MNREVRSITRSTVRERTVRERTVQERTVHRVRLQLYCRHVNIAMYTKVVIAHVYFRAEDHDRSGEEGLQLRSR